MMLRVDASSALPVYEQIRAQVTRMAVAGTLTAGARLPTIRQLAADLGIAKGTVARAYELLETSAVVQSRGSKGTFILDRTHDETPDPVALANAAEAFAVAARQGGIDLAEAQASLTLAWKNLGGA